MNLKLGLHNMSCEFKMTQNVFYLMKLKFTGGGIPYKSDGDGRRLA